MPAKEKKSKRDQLTELVLEFLEASVHQFLYVWKIYPAESFTKRVIYDAPVHMSRHPQLCEYVHSMLVGCRPWIRSGELEKLQVVLLTENGAILRRLSVETGWNTVLTQTSTGLATSGATEAWEHSDEPLPLLEINEKFRAAIVALTATPVTYGYDPKPSATSAAASFRLLAHTTEDASRSGTALDEESPANSWVYADRYWYDNEDPNEEQKSNTSHELLPVTSIQGEQFPLRMQMYLEER